MMRKGCLVALVAMAAAFPAGAMAQDAKPPSRIVANPAGFEWKEAPFMYPKGAKMAILSGDPAKSGPYAVMIKLPARYQMPAQWHSQHQEILVVSGRLYVGLGDKLDLDKTETAKPGSYIFVPSKLHHYAYTRSSTMFELHGVGPVDINYIDPADDPRNKKK